MTKINIYFFLLVLLCACQNNPVQKAEETEKEVFSLDLKAISNKIIELADLENDENVLLVMAPGEFNDIINELSGAIEASGANYLGAISVTEEQPEAWSSDWVKERIGKSDEELTSLFEDVDLGIMLPGASPTHQPYKVLQDMLQEGSRRTIHFHWAGAYDLNGNLLETDAEKSQFYQNVILNTDYKELAEAQIRFENAMRNSIIRVTTQEGTDIVFQIGDRPVTKQDGNASAARASKGLNLIDREIEIPSGAIRVAPIEESVNGTIAFPDANWDGERVSSLKVAIENGKIINIKAKEGEEAVIKEMEKAGDSGKSFREFALGFNPMMPIQQTDSPWIPYYGYGAGVVRLSLGDNTELGGKVGGGYVRWNFFTNATVSVDDDVWVDEGRLLK